MVYYYYYYYIIKRTVKLGKKYLSNLVGIPFDPFYLFARTKITAKGLASDQFELYQHYEAFCKAGF